MQQQKVTAHSSEQSLVDFFRRNTVFEVPFFQRTYKWKIDQVTKLWDDILSLYEEEKEVHFLGAVIFHQRSSEPGKPVVYEIIDGQQRITSIFLLICAFIRWFTVNRHFDRSIDLITEYTIIPRQKSSNARLKPSKDDRAQINYVFDKIFGNKELTKKLNKDNKFIRTDEPVNSKKDGRVKNTFNKFNSFLKSFSDNFDDDQTKFEEVEKLLRLTMNSLSIVSLNVIDKSNGPVIFDSLNYGQEPMTIGELVKNGIFARISDASPDEITNTHNSLWEPFAKNFGDKEKTFTDFFFPYGLIKDSNIKKNKTYTTLLNSWGEMGPQEIIDDMANFQLPYLSLVLEDFEDNFIKNVNVKALITKLQESKFPQSSLPFLMQLLRAEADEKIKTTDTVEILEYIHSFFVRRAICGHEPTGLHAVFKSLWKWCIEGKDLEGKKLIGLNKRNVKLFVESLPTVKIPTDEEVIKAVQEENMYSKNIVRFLIKEFDRDLGGEQPDNNFHIEHILPQKISDEWKKYFSIEEHKQHVHTLANLIPLTQKLNNQASNKIFKDKKIEIEDNAMFKSTRQVFEDCDEWNLLKLQERSKTLSNWAIKKWKL